MYFARFLDGFRNVVGGGTSAEVNSNGMLSGGNVDDGWRTREESRVFGEVGYAEGGRHDNEA